MDLFKSLNVWPSVLASSPGLTDAQSLYFLLGGCAILAAISLWVVVENLANCSRLETQKKWEFYKENPAAYFAEDDDEA